MLIKHVTIKKSYGIHNILTPHIYFGCNYVHRGRLCKQTVAPKLRPIIKRQYAEKLTSSGDKHQRSPVNVAINRRA